MRTWNLLHTATQRFAELTWSEYEVEVTLGTVGQEGETQRHTFTHAEEMKEFIEDWLEELALDGFVEGRVAPGPDKPIPYAEIEARARKLGSLGDCVDGDGDGTAVDPLDDTEEDDELSFDEETQDVEPEYVVKHVVSLSVDEAFDERIKEDPYDIDVPP